MRNYLIGHTAENDIGQLLENVVFIELIRRRNKVWVGKYDNLEVDFVAKNHGEIAYYQVATKASEESTLKRELTPLANIRDNYPKYLLTLEDGTKDNPDGIKTANIIDWLL